MPNWLKNIINPTGKAALIGVVAAIFPLLSAFGVQIPTAVPGSLTAFLVALIVLISVSSGSSALHRGDAPEESKPADPKPPTTIAILLMIFSTPILIIIGCGFFNSPGGKVVECSAATAANALAALCPMPVTPLCIALSETAYEEACQVAADAGADQDHAHRAGVAAARNSIDKISKRGIKLEGAK